MTDEAKTALELVEDCVELRVESSAARDEARNLSEAFERLTGLPAKVFKKASDVIYYQGGYPSESTSPRYVSIAEALVGTLAALDAVGSEQLRDHLAVMGVKVELSPREKIINSAEAAEILKSVGISADQLEIDGSAETGRYVQRRDVAAALMARSQEIQKVICDNADAVKDAAASAEETLGCSRGAFLKTVDVAATRVLRSREKMLERIDEVSRVNGDTDAMLSILRAGE